MKEHPSDIATLLRRALQAQVDLGLGEMIIESRPTAENHAESRSSDPSTLPVDLFGTSEMTTKEPEYESLAAHRAAICDCQKCLLGATRTKFVYGVGNPDADIMFVGEAPGRDEDLQGEPFVGRAGKLLDKILAAMKLSRDQVYIANILKCRPPNNRDPLPEEMEQCLPYLLEQIRLIKPKVICALGRIAGQALLKTSTPLGKLRGRWHEFEGVPLMVTYHPAALLRFPSYKQGTWDDMQMLMTKLKEM